MPYCLKIKSTRKWDRGEGRAELLMLNKLYEILRLHTNFFMPSVKLKSKERDGARVTKRYAQPTTTYRRVLASEHVEPKAKEHLTQIFVTLNPIPDKLEKQPSNFRAKFGVKIFAKYLSSMLDRNQTARLHSTKFLE